MGGRGTIRFFNEAGFTLRHRKRLKAFLIDLLLSKGRKVGEINIIFCNDKRLLSINRRFLKHDYYTDIITFDFSREIEIIAEIYISIDRVRENAVVHGVSFSNELHRVIFHGFLHLAGYGDKTKAQTVKMRAEESVALKRYFEL